MHGRGTSAASFSKSSIGVLLASVLEGAPVAPVLEVGEEAPDFALPSTLGEEISLRQFWGKPLVLMESYGADFAPV
jgi:hypothetical protein